MTNPLNDRLDRHYDRLAAIDEDLSWKTARLGSLTARLGSLTARIQRLEEGLAAARAPTDRPPLRRPPSEPLGATHDDPNPWERYYRALWLLERAQPMIDELVNITEGDK